ncbi:MAG: SRPBCC domain-containing protein [Chryseolinea sp.]
METAEKTQITVETKIKAGVDKVWKHFSEPAHINQWAFASDEWEAKNAENDLRVGGAFKTTMAAKDGSFSFDFGGVYDIVKTNELIEYTIGDGRSVKVIFETIGNETIVTETFEAEGTNPVEMQRSGWQAILENFRKHVESN